MSIRPAGFGVGQSGPGSVRAQKERQARATELRQIVQSLSPDERQFYEQNPHIQQVVACARPLQEKQIFTQQDRILNLQTASRAPYEERKDEIKTVVHSGQRKLLDTEIEFLTRFTTPSQKTYVVYAGAAGGRHHEIMDGMFPNIQFLLYDPNKFVIGNAENRQIFQEFFTTSTAQELATKFRQEQAKCLFISDVRRVEEHLSSAERQQMVLEDLQMQRTWLQILNPAASLLKFVMPYPSLGIPEQISYLDGIIFLQPWAGPTSTETRLLVTNNNSNKVYDVLEYEQVMFYYNTVTRTTYFEQVQGVPQQYIQCHCYDCVAELFILSQYAAKYQPNLDISAMVNNISRLF